jgi:hypothetical protein
MQKENTKQERFRKERTKKNRNIILIMLEYKSLTISGFLIKGRV